MTSRDLSKLSAAKQALLEKRLRAKPGAGAGAGASAPEGTSSRIAKRTKQDLLPLSFAQQRLWFLDQLEGGKSPAYNVPFVWTARGALHHEALEKSINQIISRHEALRTTFRSVNGQPEQVIHEQMPIEVPLYDLSQLPEAEKRAEARALTQQLVYRLFDLQGGSLTALSVLKLSEQEHLVILNLHHIVSDGWSMGVVMQELATLYDGYVTGTARSLPELPVQYADYALWQRDWLQGEALQGQLSYWKKQLGGELPTLQLPTDRPRPSRQTQHGAAYEFDLPAELYEGLKELSRQEGATLFMTMLAAFAAVLSRYAGQQDLLIGSPVANRRHSEIEGLIGFFVNTLVMRADLSGNPTFRELIGRVRQVAMEAFAHQDLPFEKLVEELQPEREASQSPLFNVMFVLVNTGKDELRLHGLSLERQEFAAETAKFDLTLVVGEGTDGLHAGLEYNTDLFDEATVERLASHFVRLLQAAVQNPDGRVAGMKLLTPQEEQLLSDWNQTAAEFPAHSCLHDLVTEQAHKTPDAIAVEMAGEGWTYRELQTRSDDLAAWLQAHGVSQGDRVGIALSRSLRLPLAVLAVMKAGGVVVGLAQDYPEERLAAIFADARPALVLTEEKLAGRYREYGVPMLLVDQEQIPAASEPPSQTVRPQDLAYLIYTSGSTGKPKAISMPHRPIVNMVAWQVRDFAFKQPARTLQFSTLIFDIFYQELFATWMTGGTLILLQDEVRRNPEALLGCLLEEQVQRVYLPVAALQHLAETAQTKQTFPTDLQEVAVAGEQLQITPALRVFFENLPGAVLHNHYGPSEAHVITRYTLSGAATDWDVLPPVGSAVDNVRLYVLDELMQPVPVGVTGELFVGGVALADGYWEREELTAQAFFWHDFADGSRERLYRTGDLVSWRRDGNLLYRGRIDGQVKIRGYRVELGEIETALHEHLSVSEAVAGVYTDDDGNKRLVAYVVQNAVTEERVNYRAYLAERLPSYMVPASIMLLEALPVTVTGKVDRRALPKPDGGAVEGDAQADLPRNSVEELLAGLYAQVLGVKNVGLRDNFFHLGGHSLLLTQVASRLRDVFGVELPLQKLFDAPTVEELAPLVEAAISDGASVLPAIPKTQKGARLPLSFAQQRLWFLDRFQGAGEGDASYNMPSVMKMQGELDLDALRRSIGEIVSRHDALRTVFAEADGHPYQVVLPELALDVPFVDLSSQEGDIQALADQLVAAEVARRFDLARGPLISAKVIGLGQQEYLLVMNVHHIVSDGWSIGVLMKELTALYAAYVQGQPAPFAPLPIQYPDYAVWQRNWLEGETMQRQLSYWNVQLAGDLPALRLPTDHPRPARKTYVGRVESFKLPLQLAERLKEVSRAEGATLFMTLLSAFSVLLGRYALTDDVVVGTPVAGRRQSETEALIGFFVNTLAMRTDLSGDPTFAELLRRVRKMSLEAYAHQDVPFEKLVEEIQPERDPSHSPLFQVMFVLLNMDLGGQEVPGLSLSMYGFEAQTAKFDLTLFASEEEDGLLMGLEYNTDLFTRETILRMAGHLHTLLEAIVEHPHLQTSRLPIMGAAERQAALQAACGPTVEIPEDLTVHALVEAQAARTPDAVAVEYAGNSLSYRELNARANSLAVRLRELGAGPNVPVGLSLNRGLHLMVAMLGVLKAGSPYVALDPAYPAERLAVMVQESRVPILVTEAGLADLLPAVETTLFVNGVEDLPPLEENVDSGVTQADLAYVLYTSGTTGTPKGVAMPHRALVNLLLWQEAQLPAGELARTLQFASLNFDASFQDSFSTWMNGGTMILISEEDRRDAYAMLRHVQQERVTRLFIPFVALQQLAEASAATGIIPTCIRQIITAGEQLQVTHSIRDLFAKLPDAVLFNEYGPSETHVITQYTLPGASENWNLLPSIGDAIWNTQLLVLDEHRQPVPFGVPGELYAGGMSLADGYLHRPELTRERFIEWQAAADAPAERVYRTGDLVRLLPDGNLLFLGRIDLQVKIRGYRVEPAEIEAALAQHPDVVEAAVLALEITPGQRSLVAYVVSESGAELVSEMKSYLTSKLPSYMIPSAFVPLPELPVTPNGKVDRRRLPSPERAHFAADGEYVAPRNEAEETIVSVFADLLGVEQVGIHDNFFALGGHSLLATQVISRLCKSFAVEVPLSKLFECPTPAELSALLTGLQGEEQPQSPVPLLQQRDTVGPRPLSFAQQRLWFLDRLQEGAVSHNLPLLWQIEGELDTEALSRSLRDIVRRHEALRTVFVLQDGTPAALVQEAGDLLLTVSDLTGLPPERRDAEVRQKVQADLERPFDLSQGPLVRALLIRTGEATHVLLLNMHHIIVDGWSLGVLTGELAARYTAYQNGQQTQFPALPVQYGDYALWQQEWLQGDRLEQQLAYWREVLGGELPILQLPADHARPSFAAHRAGMEQFSLSPELSDALRSLSRKHGVTLYMTLLAALMTLLHRLSGDEDLLIGTPVAGRTSQELEPLIGFFVNTLVLRGDLSADPTFVELLSRVNKTALGAFEHQDLPFEKLVAELQPERAGGQTPLFSVMFQVLYQKGHELELPGLTLTPLDSMPLQTNFDLGLFFMEGDAELSGNIEYSADIFEASTIRRLVEQLEMLLRSVTSDPSQQLSQLQVLTAEQKSQLADWSETITMPAPELPVYRLFEQQAARTPDRTAVRFEQEQLTYRELCARANQLARHLQAVGAGRQTLVGICLERSLDLVVALLAVWKAGSAFVPLDPAYPQERLALILEDTNLPLLLTTEALQSTLPQHGAQVVLLDADCGKWADLPEEDLETTAGASDLAYLIYTSGSTGRPKAVAIEQRNLAATLQASREHFQFEPGDVFPWIASYAFDISLFELLNPLLTGGISIVLSREHLLDLPRLVRDLKQYTMIHTVPSLMRQIVDHINGQEIDSACYDGLRTIFIGGDAVPPELLSAMHDTFRRADIRVLYGPTEAAIICAQLQVPRGAKAERPLIGRAMHQAKLRICDAIGNLVPIGVPGELYIGGLGVARGYFERPELTALQFVELEGERWYKSGDLVRCLADGTLEFLGRLDHQVKIRGFRIELGEIEAALGEHPAVSVAVVLAREINAGDKQLVAYVSPRDNAALSAAELRSALQARLPEHMVPSFFVLLDAMPMTATGKIDRKQLPLPVHSAAGDSRFIAPRDCTELAMAQLWAEVLGVQAVGSYDNFFEIGGHSLKAVALMEAIRKRFDVSLPLTALFQSPTVASLASILRGEAAADSDGVLVLLQKGDNTRPPLFLLPPQGGGVMSYLPLVQGLAAEETVYGLQSVGYESDEAPFATMEEIAERFLAEIQAVQPQGPYRLAGWSFGGVAAYELARRLEGQGQEVEFLGLIDAMLIDPAGGAARAEGHTEEVALIHQAAQLDMDLSLLQGLSVDAGLDLVLRRAHELHRLPEGTTPESMRQKMRVTMNNGVAGFSYVPPGAVRADLTLFRCSEVPPQPELERPLVDPEQWSPYTQGTVNVIPVPGDHHSLFLPPNVQELAEQLNVLLRTSQEA
ncbi:hypothetical protein CBW65_18870 [Tumebacillus avium]|uniref:Carrier domain-containing protein n=1 Tax=Tumebacillus avium TaxID=1903704 RepID=A0A1Y0IU01_9BACL|nr:non-ribosomal peptide synthetase [Tumebacillus avium]ARU62804.1 hypothetical protein CBW65_18870 [Tumebacillus avium]